MPNDTDILIETEPTASTISSPVADDKNCLEKTAKCVSDLMQYGKDRCEPTAGLAGAYWFVFSWGASYLEWQDGSRDYYNTKLFQDKLVPFFDGERLTVNQAVAGSIATLSLFTLTSAICVSIINKLYPQPSGNCSCASCMKTLFGCVGNFTRLTNYIIGNPGYWWAHADMALTCAGTNYRREPEAHMITAVFTSAMAVFLLIYNLVTFFREKKVCLCGGCCSGCKNLANICNRLAKFIDGLGANGAGRTGWMWAFYVMVTTILMPIIYKDENFSMANHEPLIAPICGFGLTCVSLCYNYRKRTCDWIVGPVSTLITSLKKLHKKKQEVYGVSPCDGDDGTLLAQRDKKQ